MISALGTTIAKLQENKKILASIFGEFGAQRNEKWTKYLGCGVLQLIQTLEKLEDVTTEIAAELFQWSCNTQPE